MRPKLVLLASEFPPGPGGIGRHTYELASHLTLLSWDVFVVAPQPYAGAEACNTFNAQLPFRFQPMASGAFALVRYARRCLTLARLLIRERPSVLIASGERPLWAGAVANALTRVPLVVIAHGTEFHRKNALPKFLTRLAVRRASAIVAHSQYTKDLLRRAVPRAASAKVIPPGVRDRFFHPLPNRAEIRERLGLQGRSVLLTVGRLCQRKGQDTVIQALPQVVVKHPATLYLMAGLPENRLELECLAGKLGVAGNVRYLGVLSDEELRTYYNAADLFVLVSRATPEGDVEGYGMVVLEAAACGRTAIVSSGCGLEEAVDHGRCGVIVPPDSPDETAKAILRLLDDVGLRADLEERALSFARSCGWEVRAAQYAECLREAIGPR